MTTPTVVYKDPVAFARMTKARARLITSQPFFGTLALHLKLVEDYSIPTMATDGESIFYNPDFVATLTDEEVEFVIAHEAYHCANLHHTRRHNREHVLWNVACDYVVNADLQKAGFHPPKDIFLDPQYDGLGSEDVYAILDKKAKEAKGKGGQQNGQPQPGQGQTPQDGSGSGTGYGEILDAAPNSPAKTGEVEAEWQTITRQAVNVATRAAGSLPSNLERLVADLKKPQQDWREILRRFVEQGNNIDYSWSCPDRRFATAPFILPGTVKDGINHVAVAIDTSGSINAEILSRFRAEVQSLLDEGAVDRITVLYCDARVQHHDEFQAGDIVKFNPVGGGGTRFGPVWEWLDNNEPDVSAVVYFTDLYGDFGQAPAQPVLWAAYGDPRSIRSISVPFGEVVELTE